MMAVCIALPKNKKIQDLLQHYIGARKLQAWLAAKDPPVELAVREPPLEAHPFCFEELVMMEPSQVHQEKERMCSRLHGGF